jgi:hypothetical protein
MKVTNKMTTVALLLVITGVVYFIVNRVPKLLSEKYRVRQSDYRYGLIDTNPNRRVAEFFDNCSPENMGDCKRNNPYEGLPLP